jgi:hypothetical protein
MARDQPAPPARGDRDGEQCLGEHPADSHDAPSLARRHADPPRRAPCAWPPRPKPRRTLVKGRQPGNPNLHAGDRGRAPRTIRPADRDAALTNRYAGTEGPE